jgi:hypothetical protein
MLKVVTPVNITGAAMITQIFIIVIMAVGAIVLAWGNKFAPVGPTVESSSFIFILLILVLALTTMGALFFSDSFWEVWKPLFGGVIPPVLQWSSSIRIVFTLDIIGVMLLVLITGGGQGSPFSPIFFTLPALAIFLREPLSRIIYYLVLTSLAFTVTMRRSCTEWTETVGGSVRSFAYWFISVSSFLLATFIGIITRSK